MARNKQKNKKKRASQQPSSARPQAPGPEQHPPDTGSQDTTPKMIEPVQTASGPTALPQRKTAPKVDRFVVQISEFVYLRAFFLIGVFGLLFYLTFLLRKVLAPVLIALALAYLINPLVDTMQRKGVKRNLAIWLLVASMFGLSLVGWFVFVPKILSSLELFSQQLAKIPPLLIKGKAWMETTLNVHFPKTWVEALTTWSNEIKNVAPQIIKPLKGIVTALFSGGMGILSWFFTLLLIPLFTFYFLKGYDSIRHRVVDYIPLDIRDKLLGRLGEIDRILSGYMRGQVTVSLIVGSLYMILLSSIQLPLAPAIAAGGAILNIVPYLGFLTTYLIALIAALIEFQLQWQFFLVLIGMLAIHMFDVLYITPTVVGEQVGLSEIVVIFAVLAGGQLFGLIGVLLAIPLAAVIKVALTELLLVYQESHFYTGTSGEDKPK